MPPDAGSRENGHKLFRILVVEHAFGRKQAYALAALASYGEASYKTERQIALFVGCCRSTVAKAVRKAKELGVIVATRIKQGEIPPGGYAPTKTGLSLRRFTAFGVRSLSRIAAIWASNALRNVFRQAKADENRREKAEIRAACAELRRMPD